MILVQRNRPHAICFLLLLRIGLFLFLLVGFLLLLLLFVILLLLVVGLLRDRLWLVRLLLLEGTKSNQIPKVPEHIAHELLLLLLLEQNLVSRKGGDHSWILG